MRIGIRGKEGSKGSGKLVKNTICKTLLYNRSTEYNKAVSDSDTACRESRANTFTSLNIISQGIFRESYKERRHVVFTESHQRCLTGTGTDVWVSFYDNGCSPFLLR